MSEMIERMARAICEAKGLDWNAQANAFTSASGSDEEQDGFRSDARAALEAMREPTEDVLREGADKMRYGKQVVPPHHAKFVWQAMIDAALAK